MRRRVGSGAPAALARRPGAEEATGGERRRVPESGRSAEVAVAAAATGDAGEAAVLVAASTSATDIVGSCSSWEEIFTTTLQ